MYIGKVSQLTGATPKAIRHYERIGLIAQPGRKGNYRYYSEADLDAIRLVKKAQKYGFKLSELETLVKKMGTGKTFPYAELIELIGKKRQQIQLEIDKLSALDEGLAELSEQVQSHKCSC